MDSLRKSKKWRDLVGLIDDGYKGVFVILRILDESDGEVLAGDVAREMNVSTARVARALNYLEEKSYVARGGSASDARKVVISLTDEGKDALEKRKRSISEIVSPLFANLTDEETAELFRLLNKVLN